MCVLGLMRGRPSLEVSAMTEIPALRRLAEKDELEDDEYDEFKAALKDRYRFYIMNPSHSRGVEYSLWVTGEEGEFPVVNSNTGGFVTFNSRSEEVGDALELSDEFYTLLGVGFHEMMCFTPPTYFETRFEESYESIYDGKAREHEVWLAHILLDWMAAGEQVIPELRPLAEWANKHTEFGCPVLGGDGDD